MIGDYMSFDEIISKPFEVLVKLPFAKLKEVFMVLLNIVEDLSTENKEIKTENQKLKDEINRLKGEKGGVSRLPNKKTLKTSRNILISYVLTGKLSKFADSF